MNACNLIDSLAQRGIPLALTLEVVNSDRLTDAERQALRTHRDEIIDILRQARSTDSGATCWKCGAGRQIPSAPEQVRTLAELQRGMPEEWQWSSKELARLEARIGAGDAIVAMFIESVRIKRHDGSFVEHHRRQGKTAQHRTNSYA